MKTKTFDCVRMKRDGAERVMKQLQEESVQEQLEYWEKGTEDFKKLQQKLRRIGGTGRCQVLFRRGETGCGEVGTSTYHRRASAVIARVGSAGVDYEII